MLPAGGTERRRSTDGEQSVAPHYADVIAISSGLSEGRVGAGHTGTRAPPTCISPGSGSWVCCPLSRVGVITATTMSIDDTLSIENDDGENDTFE